jgi:hypothetical protein
VRLDDNEIRISGARRADVTGVGAWEPPCRGIGIAKILKKLQLHPRQGCHPVDVGLLDSEAYRKSAQAEYGCCENLSIDADAPVAIDAQGAWVQAWVWVPKITLRRTDKSS